MFTVNITELISALNGAIALLTYDPLQKPDLYINTRIQVLNKLKKVLNEFESNKTGKSENLPTDGQHTSKS